MKNHSESEKRKKPLIRSLALIMAVTLVMLMTACSGSFEDRPADAGDQKEVSVIKLAFYPHGHVLNVIADDQGYLEEEGIKVQYVKVATDQEVFEGIEKGTIDIASNSGTNLPLERIASGQDLTIFGGYLLTGCMPIFAKEDTEWKGIESLIGKKVAFEPNLYCITGPLLDKGYDPIKQIDWYETANQEERIEAVKKGKADYGLVGTHLNNAVNTDPELKVCTYASDVLPEYSCCRVVANTEWVNENPETVKALLRAWIRALAYYDSHHDETVALMVGETGQSEEYIRAYMDNPHCDINVDPMKSAVRRAWNYMDKLGLLSTSAEKIDINDHINTELYKEALDECQEKYGSDNPKFYEKMQGQYAKNNIAYSEDNGD
ncbi:MAG: ABC transporter substrate-binding protein [Clostridiales bacterium]|nr:ABC transporter substrate-binding protein [Clostridiales bacterium]